MKALTLALLLVASTAWASYEDGHPVEYRMRLEENGCMVVTQDNRHGNPEIKDYALACDGLVQDGNEQHATNDLEHIREFRAQVSALHKACGLGRVRWAVRLIEWAGQE